MSNPREISHHDEDYAKMKTDRAMGIQDHKALELKVIELEMQLSNRWISVDDIVSTMMEH